MLPYIIMLFVGLLLMSMYLLKKKEIGAGLLAFGCAAAVVIGYVLIPQAESS